MALDEMLQTSDGANDAAEEGVSIEDEMRDTIARIEADERGEEPPTKPEPEDAAPTQSLAERPRGPDGKFVKAEEAQASDPQRQAQAPAAFQDKGPPTTWRPAAKAAWDALPEGAKAEIYKREQDVFAGIEQFRAKAQTADALMQVITPYQPLIAAAGTNIPGALQEVLRTAATFYVGTPAQKVAALRAIAQTHGIDLASAVGNTAAPQAFRDPVVEQLNGRIAQLEGNLVSQQRAAQNSELNAAAGQIAAFRDDPANRYFPNVSFQMGQLMNAGLAANLKDAYEKACSLNPEVRAAIQAERDAAQAKKDADDRAKRVRDARRAGSIGVRSTPPPAPLGQPNGTWDDTMHAAYAQIVGS